MCERGLFRSQDQIENGLGHVLFPDLHEMKDDAVARKMSRDIRANLPSSLSIDDRNTNSSKSLRQAGVNILAMNTDMGFLQAIL